MIRKNLDIICLTLLASSIILVLSNAIDDGIMRYIHNTSIENTYKIG